MKIETADDQLMVFAAIRYCLGRETYIVGTCCDWLCEHWGQIGSRTQEQIESEILGAIDKGRAGAEMDVAEWKLLLARVDVCEMVDKEW